MPVLSEGPRDTPAHQRTLEATLAWSYDLLGPEERYLFRLLSVFSNGFSLEAAETLTSRDARRMDVLGTLVNLIDHHLVSPKEDRGTDPRFFMLETVRAHAFQRLAAAGEETDTRRRHAVWVLQICEARDGGMSEQGWLDLIEREHRNVRSALEWATLREDVNVSQRLVAALGLYFWLVRGYVEEGRRWARRALALGSGTSARVFAEVVIAASVFATYSSDFVEAETLARKALEIEENAGDRVGRGMALFHIAHARSARDGMEETEAMLEEASDLLSAANTLNERRVAALVFHNRAVAAAMRGDYVQSRDLAEEAVARWRVMDSEWGLAGTMGLLADTEVLRGDYAQAVVYGQQALSIRWNLGARMGVVDAMLLLARAIAGIGSHGDLVTRLQIAAGSLAAEMGLVTVPEFQKVIAAEKVSRHGSGYPEYSPVETVEEQRNALANVIADVLAIPATSLPGGSDLDQVLPLVPLTARERQVLGLVAKRRTDQEIADHLFLSRRTISGHVAHTMVKLGVSSRQEAVSRARNLGILARDDHLA